MLKMLVKKNLVRATKKILNVMKVVAALDVKIEFILLILILNIIIQYSEKLYFYHYHFKYLI